MAKQTVKPKRIYTGHEYYPTCSCARCKRVRLTLDKYGKYVSKQTPLTRETVVEYLSTHTDVIKPQEIREEQVLDYIKNNPGIIKKDESEITFENAFAVVSANRIKLPKNEILFTLTDETADLVISKITVLMEKFPSESYHAFMNKLTDESIIYFLTHE